MEVINYVQCVHQDCFCTQEFPHFRHLTHTFFMSSVWGPWTACFASKKKSYLFQACLKVVFPGQGTHYQHEEFLGSERETSICRTSMKCLSIAAISTTEENPPTCLLKGRRGKEDLLEAPVNILSFSLSYCVISVWHYFYLFIY